MKPRSDGKKAGAATKKVRSSAGRAKRVAAHPEGGDASGDASALANEAHHTSPGLVEHTPLGNFVTVCDDVQSTSKRLQKAERVGVYLRALGDEDLKHAARFLSGTVFPLWDERTLSVGLATLLAVLTELGAGDAEALRKQLVKLGDAGELCATVLPKRRASLTLHAVQQAFADIAATRGTAKKRAALCDLLQCCAPSEAKYVVKLLSGELRIGLQEGAVEDSIARSFERPLADVQWANMLLGDIGEVALLARYDRLRSAEIRLFHPLKFMLATAAETAEEAVERMPEIFVAEDKYDGIRAQAHVAWDVVSDVADRIGVNAEDPGSRSSKDTLALAARGSVHEGVRVALFSRTLDEITDSFPELVPDLARAFIKHQAHDAWILDGEIVPMRGDVTLPFADLQKRLGRKKPTEAIMQEVPAIYTVFDILCVDASMLILQTWQARRDTLTALPLQADHLRLTESPTLHDADGIELAFTAARARNNEGLILKDPASSYKPGRRGREWLKVKRPLATLDVVVTSVEVGHGRRREWLSDYTFAVRASADDSTLLNIGKAYSGLTDAEIATMTEWFRAHTLQQFAHGKVRVVEPNIVIEVAFDRVQASARHKSGFALRFPRIVRLRPDKDLHTINTLADVRALVQQEQAP